MKWVWGVMIVMWASCAVPAFAQNVKSPNVEKGLLELEQKGRYFMDSAQSRDNRREFEFNAIYGVTERWKTKIETTFDDDAGRNLVYRRLRFENVLQLTKSKEGFFADTALYNDVTISGRSDTSHDVTFGVLARKDIATTTNTANFYIRKDYGDAAVHGTNVIYRWQTRYNLWPEFQPGFEILGDTRKRDAFRDQSLAIGPGLFGSFTLDDPDQKLGYELVMGFGATPTTQDAMLKWKLKYAIQF